MQILLMNLIVYNGCKPMKLLIITWVHICISFNKLLWFMQKNDKIDILSLVFMPFTGNKSPGAKKGSDEWQCDNFTNIFWIKRTFTYFIILQVSSHQNHAKQKVMSAWNSQIVNLHAHRIFMGWQLREGRKHKKEKLV